MKPPLYRSSKSLAVQHESNGNGSTSPNHLFHRSASLDTPGVINGCTKIGIVDSSSSPLRRLVDEVSAGSGVEGNRGVLDVPKPPPLPRNFFSTSTSVAWSHKLCRRTVGVCVPQETVQAWDRLFYEGMNVDVMVCTEDGGATAAHSLVLAAASPVFKKLLSEQRPGKHQRKAINIIGVPYDAVRVFTRFLYSSRYEKQEMEQYVMHLLVLSHVYSVSLLKRVCTQELEQGLLTPDNVIDVLQLARLCDVPRLNVICLKLVVNSFKIVVKSEGWRVMRESNQALEQELVGHVIEMDAKRQERLRKAEEERVYKQLHDAMEALVHICRDGCRTIWPQEKDGSKSAAAAGCKFAACKGLESLVRHFAGCKTKVSGGCVHCKRMWQLLELHSRMCSDTESCKVPLCKHFKDRIGQQSKKEEARWKLLVSKVTAAKGASTGFSLAAVSATLEQEP